jgi:hypothetical protein
MNRQDCLPVITLVPGGHGFSQKIMRNRFLWSRLG